MLIFAALLLAPLERARADGWKIEVMGMKAVAGGYAGSIVVAWDASIVWFNPAGMTELEGTTITAGVPIVVLGLEFVDRGSTSLIGQPLTGEHRQEAGRTSPVPHFYIVKEVNDRTWIGFGLNVPFGLGTDYGETWVGRYQATETTLLVFNLNPSAAFKVSDQFSIGGGVNIQYSDATFANMIDFGSIGAAAGLPLTPQMHDGKVSISGTDWRLGFDLGALWQPTESTRFGVTFRSGTEHDVEGTATFSVPTEAAPITGGGLIFKDTAARTSLPMPATLSVGASQRLAPHWTLLGDVTWTDWSTFDTLVVEFENPLQPPIVQAADWDDTWRFSVGAMYEASDRWTFLGGYAYQQTPVPDATRGPRVPEGYHNWFTAGGSYARSERMRIDFSYGHLTTGDAPINLSDPTAGRLVGDAIWSLNSFSAAATWLF